MRALARGLTGRKWVQAPLGLYPLPFLSRRGLFWNVLGLMVTQLSEMRLVSLGGCTYSDAAGFFLPGIPVMEGLKIGL